MQMRREIIFAAAALLVLGSHAVLHAQLGRFYRIVSTQETRILSFLCNDGQITWSNAIPDSECIIENAMACSGPWHTNFARTLVASYGLTLQRVLNCSRSTWLVRVPMGEELYWPNVFRTNDIVDHAEPNYIHDTQSSSL
jgi:hypothetical protein